MSNVQVFFAQNKLTKALRDAPKRTAKECLEQANENLRQIASACLEQVGVTLDALEAAVRQWRDVRDDASLAEAYLISQRVIGVASIAGKPELDQAAASLCDVIDSMRTLRRYKYEPVDVHVAAMRLLYDPAGQEIDPALIVTDLHQVRDIFLTQARSQIAD